MYLLKNEHFSLTGLLVTSLLQFHWSHKLMKKQTPMNKLNLKVVKIKANAYLWAQMLLKKYKEDYK